MFYGCSSLNYIRCLKNDVNATVGVSNWTSGVASTGTFVCAVRSGWAPGVNGIPNNWEIIVEGEE